MSFLVDSHCHLDRVDLSPFQGGFSEMMNQAKSLGVGHMIAISVDFETLPAVLSIAEKFATVSASVGVHPTEVGCHEPSEEELVVAAAHAKVVAIGETGLDYYRLEALSAEAQKTLQQERFSRHIRAALKVQKPLVIHTRCADDDTIDLLKAEQAQGGVLHCFTGTWDMAKRALDLGFYISFSGILTFKNAEDLRDIAAKIPLDRLLVETDSPYLTPVPYRGKPNHPGYVRYVAELLAEIKKVPYEVVARETTLNAQRLFKLVF